MERCGPNAQDGEQRRLGSSGELGASEGEPWAARDGRERLGLPLRSLGPRSAPPRAGSSQSDSMTCLHRYSIKVAGSPS